MQVTSMMDSQMEMEMVKGMMIKMVLATHSNSNSNISNSMIKT
jgi:hypothetical protein